MADLRIRPTASHRQPLLGLISLGSAAVRRKKDMAQANSLSTLFRMFLTIES
jgi:hypothetical protein